MVNTIEQFTGLNEAELAFAVPAIDLPEERQQRNSGEDDPGAEFAFDMEKGMLAPSELRRSMSAFVQVGGIIKKRPHSHNRNSFERSRPRAGSVVSNLAIPFEIEDLSDLTDTNLTEEKGPDLISQSVASFRKTLKLGRDFVVTPQQIRTGEPTINVSFPQKRMFPRRFR